MSTLTMMVGVAQCWFWQIYYCDANCYANERGSRAAFI